MASKVEIILEATDAASATIQKVNGELGISEEQINRVGSESQATGMSWTDLNAAVSLGKEAFAIANQVMDETVGKFQAYAQQVRDLSAISGQSAEDTSRFIQVLDDYRISAEDATTATKALTKQGLAPNMETLAILSDQYLAITDTQARNEFVLKNLGKAGLEWNQVLQQGGTALRENAAAQQGGLILNDQMLARAEKLRLAQDQLNDSWDAFSITVGERAVPLITSALDNFNTRVEESGFASAVFQTGFDDIIQVFQDAAGYADGATTSTNNLTNAQAAAIPTAEELAAAQKAVAEEAQKVSDINNKMVSAIGSLQTADDNYTKNAKGLTDQRLEMEANYSAAKSRGYEKTVGEYKGYEDKIASLKQKEADLSAERDKQTLQFISNILLQKLQVDGLTTAEFEAFAKQQKAWGLWSDDTVAKARAAWQETDKIVASINAIPGGKTVNIAVNYTSDQLDIMSDKRAGHAAGGSFLIPDSYGNEGFRMGNGDTASGGERVTITPRGESGGSAIDYERMARVIRDALLQVSR